MEVIVRGLRGNVIPGGSDWEKLQLTFFLTSGAGRSGSTLRVSADGQIASGIGKYPPDSQFIRDLEPKYAKSLQDYTKKTATALRMYIEGNYTMEHQDE